MRKPTIQTLSETTIFSNRFGTLYNDDVKFANGATGTHLRMVSGNGNGGVVVLIARGEGQDMRLGLVQQYRYPVNSFMLEAPRGSADHAGHTSEAVREMSEETGITDATITPLGTIHPDSGILTTEVSLFMAHTEQVGQVNADFPASAESGEQIDALHWIAVPQVWKMVADGVLTDSMTISAMTRAALKGLIPFAI